MTATYTVTFEFETKPILSVHGAVSASGMPTAVARAVSTAMREAGGQPWSSVIVVIERVTPSSEIDNDNDDDAVVKPVAAVTVKPVCVASFAMTARMKPLTRSAGVGRSTSGSLRADIEARR